MTWTITDWANAKWANLDAVQDFFRAVNERSVALTGSAALTVPDEFHKIQDIAFWNQINSWIASNAASFFQSHDLSGSYWGPGHFTGQSARPVAWTYENLCKAAGCWQDASHYGPRRWSGYGVVTSGSPTGFTDSTAKWPAGGLVGLTVGVGYPPSSGGPWNITPYQRSVITANDASTITIADAWIHQPVAGHVYDIERFPLPGDWTDPTLFWQFGTMAGGDKLSAWFFHDLQKLLNCLRWTSPSGQWLGWDGYAAGENYYVLAAGHDDSDLAVAKALAAAAFPGAAHGLTDGPTYQPPGAFGSTSGGSPDWYTSLYRAYSYVRSQVSNRLASSVELYAMPAAPSGGSWYNNGDWDDADEGNFKLLDTVSVAAATPPALVVAGAQVGNITGAAPSWPPTDPGSSGWGVSDYFGLVIPSFDYTE